MGTETAPAIVGPAMAVTAIFIVALVGSIVWIQQRGAKLAPTATVNSLGQVKAGVPASADNQPPNQQAGVPDSTTIPKSTGTNPDAPVYLVRGGRPQFKDPGLPQAGRPSSTDFNADSAPSIKQGQNPGAVYVNAPVKPMVLSLQDDNGATRRISLPPVSFGSQRLLVGSRAVPVGATNDRVW